MKAIETTYRGYRFRSRLEARWAVFFDAMHYAWKYEHEGYEAGGKRYLPDFELTDEKGLIYFVEVKGDPQALAKDHERYVALLDWDGCLPSFNDCHNTGETGFILLGDIPAAAQGTCFHPIIRHHEGLHRSWFSFTPNGISVCDDSPLAVLCKVNVDWNLQSSPEHWVVETRFLTTPRAFNGVADAYDAARQARFEHGQSGASK